MVLQKINTHSQIRHCNGRQFEYLNFCLSLCVFSLVLAPCKLCAILKWSGRGRAQAVGGRGWWGSTWSSFVTCKPSRLLATRSSHVFTRNISIKSVSIKSKNCIDISLSLSHISVRLHIVRGHTNTWHIKCFYKNRIAVSELWAPETSFQTALKRSIAGNKWKEILSFKSGLIHSRDVWCRDSDFHIFRWEGETETLWRDDVTARINTALASPTS